MPGLREGLGLPRPTQLSRKPSRGSCHLLPPRPRLLAWGRARTEQLSCANFLENRKPSIRDSCFLSHYHYYETLNELASVQKDLSRCIKHCQRLHHSGEGMNAEHLPWARHQIRYLTVICLTLSQADTSYFSLSLELIEEGMESHRGWVTYLCLIASTELSQNSQPAVHSSKDHHCFHDPLLCAKNKYQGGSPSPAGKT